MAIRDEKQSILKTSEITVDLPRFDASKIKNAFTVMFNKLKAMRLTRTAADPKLTRIAAKPTKYDVRKVREQHTLAYLRMKRM